MRLVDTNVLLYAVSRLPEEAGKRIRARELLTEPELCVSVQVLQEFYHQATRSNRPGRMIHEDALEFMEPIMLLPVQAITLEGVMHFFAEIHFPQRNRRLAGAASAAGLV